MWLYYIIRGEGATCTQCTPHWLNWFARARRALRALTVEARAPREKTERLSSYAVFFLYMYIECIYIDLSYDETRETSDFHLLSWLFLLYSHSRTWKPRALLTQLPPRSTSSQKAFVRPAPKDVIPPSAATVLTSRFTCRALLFPFIFFLFFWVYDITTDSNI